MSLTNARAIGKRKRHQAKSGFSLTELVVAAGIAAAAFGTAALGYRTITAHQRNSTTFHTISLGPAITKGFYGSTSGQLDVYSVPNYGMSARAEIMRNIFWDDVAHASAIFCLPRPAITVDPLSDSLVPVAGINYIHPGLQAVPNPDNLIPPPDPQGSITFTGLGTMLDHPNKFLNLLAANYPDTVSTPFPFLGQEYRGVPATASVNGSIYILQSSSIKDKLSVRAIYDIDLLEVADPSPGTYASVKRYVPIVYNFAIPTEVGLTHYYDVLYPGSDQTPQQFGPLFACFERSVRLAAPETGNDQANAFKQAQNRPFYFIWWPDPANPRLEGRPTATYPTSDPRQYYSKHENQTTWMFTVPMFPPL